MWTALGAERQHWHQNSASPSSFPANKSGCNSKSRVTLWNPRTVVRVKQENLGLPRFSCFASAQPVHSNPPEFPAAHSSLPVSSEDVHLWGCGDVLLGFSAGKPPVHDCPACSETVLTPQGLCFCPVLQMNSPPLFFLRNPFFFFFRIYSLPFVLKLKFLELQV